jgi:hypothetical protein
MKQFVKREEFNVGPSPYPLPQVGEEIFQRLSPGLWERRYLKDSLPACGGGGIERLSPSLWETIMKDFLPT